MSSKIKLYPFIIHCSFLFLLCQNSINSFSQTSTPKDANAPLHLGPSCQFSALNNCYGDTTYFINQTIRMMNPSWKIADASGILFSSFNTDIKFLFPAPGTYSVIVYADNGHPDSLTKVLVIDTTTIADFTFQQCTQRFVNMSSCAANFYWNFGDGNFSADPLPVHLYADTGSYVVTLIASSGTMSDTMTQNICVYSKGLPTANFTYFQSNDTVYFYGDTLAENFNWDFGDQTFSPLQNPSHAYTDTGDYNVFLLVTGFCGMATQSQLIHVSPPVNVASQFEINFPLLIYPNPFKDKAVLQAPDSRLVNSQLHIFNVLGREVFPEIINNSDSIEIHKSDLTEGIYFLRLQNNEKEIYYAKFVIYAF